MFESFTLYVHRIPSRPDGTAWPEFTAKEQRTIQIDTSSFSEFKGPRTDKCSLWNDFLLNK